MLAETFDAYINFIEWFYSLDWSGLFFRVQIIAAIISLLFIVGIFLVMKKAKEIFITEPSVIGIPKVPPEEVSKSWQAVLRKVTSSNPSDWNLAILQADAILDDILKRSGFAGQTMADRLKQLDPSKLLSLNDIWSAHKMRNVIAHDPDRPVSRREIESAIDAYEKALKELEFLV